MKLKKIISITLCAALALSAAACGNNNSEAVQIPSPFVDCDTMDAAKELAGFDLTLPKAADELEAVENEMIQAFYGENNLFTLALWTNGGYTYSISVGEALSQTDMLALVSSVV